MVERPSGTVTFLFTDIEGSTLRWERDAEAMRVALAAHDDLLRDVVERHGGWVFKHSGDGVCAAFGSAQAAAEAAVDTQRSLELPVRMGLCTGEAESRDDDYFGQPLNRAARIMSAAHGGQILAGASTASMLYGINLIDLGRHRLRGVEEAVRLFQVSAEGIDERFPPLRTALSGNLPPEMTSFVGREDEVKHLVSTVRAHRLVTLTGVGGVGKTRLARRVASELLGEFADGVWLIELAPLIDGSAVAEVVASAFGITPKADQDLLATVSATLADRTLLIILDNCEHLLHDAARLTEQLLHGCPELRVLTTSRESLGVDAERQQTVRSLPVALEATAPAVELFCERAHAVVDDLDLSADVPVVAEICERLDGIPLAIELAAARLRTMSPEQVRDRLDERFRLLTGTRRSLERHQTLRHAVQWSYDLLTDLERTALDHAAVFSGGFTLGAFAGTWGAEELDEFETLDVLDALARKSLLNVDRTTTTVRYSLLETIRQFAEEQLAERPEARDVRTRHARYFAVAAEASFELLRGPREADAYELVDHDIENLRVAFQWAREINDVDTAIRIAACTHKLGRYRLRSETFPWPAAVAEDARRVTHRLLPLVLTMASESDWAMGDLAAAKTFGEEAIALRDDDRFEPLIWAFCDLAQIAAFEGDMTAAEQLSRVGATHPADARDRLCLTYLLCILSLTQPDEARRQAAETVAAVEAAGMPWAIAMALNAYGAAFANENPDAALAARKRALAVAADARNTFIEQFVTQELTAQLAKSGDAASALQTFGELIDTWQVTGDTALLGTLAHLVVLFSRLKDLDVAATIYGAGTRHVALDSLTPELPATVQDMSHQLGEARFQALRNRGKEMTRPDAAEYIRTHIDARIQQLTNPPIAYRS